MATRKTAEKKAETATKAVEAVKAEDTGKAVVKTITSDTEKTAVKRTSAKKESVKKPAVKKIPAKKAPAKKTSVNHEVQVNTYVQCFGKQVEVKELTDKVKKAWVSSGKKEEDIQTMSLYIKPEENAGYYVINEMETGAVEF